jgi:hypothetical protein
MIVASLLGYSLDIDNVACLYPVAVLYEAQVRPHFHCSPPLAGVLTNRSL